MPLNYSKWDQLELSDDSDIEGHPNVDRRSLIRWKQRDIHEKREQRKQKIAHLHAQIACNSVLLPRIQKIHADLTSESTTPSIYFNNLVEQLEKNPSNACPPGNDPTKLEQTYDGMLLELLRRITAEAKEKSSSGNLTLSEKDEKLNRGLVDEMAFHCNKLKETIEFDQKEVEKEEKEQKKHITSEDLHDGFSSTYIAPKPEPGPVPQTTPNKPTKTVTTTEYEVLNPTAAIPSSSSATPQDDEPEEDEGLPELTPALEGFSRIALKDYVKSFEYIQNHRDVIVDGAEDALLVAAFTAQGEGKSKYAKQCVHQSLLLQYCSKLGKDGVGVFFKKMITGDKRADKVFQDDVESTYAHLVQRVAASKQEAAAGGREQIQLVPESGDQTITFNVPDGPPPENLVLEGPGTENMDIEEVRKALQFRWDVFSAFPKDLKDALKENSLENVNKALGDMEVDVAEAIVQNLDMAGILNFAEGGIRDETGAKST